MWSRLRLILFLQSKIISIISFLILLRNVRYLQRSKLLYVKMRLVVEEPLLIKMSVNAIDMFYLKQESLVASSL